MTDYVLTRLAVADLEAASGYVSERVIDHVFDIIERLARGELEGPIRELRTGEVVSSWPAYPFRIYYERREGRLVVLRVYHGAREAVER